MYVKHLRLKIKVFDKILKRFYIRLEIKNKLPFYHLKSLQFFRTILIMGFSSFLLESIDRSFHNELMQILNIGKFVSKSQKELILCYFVAIQLPKRCESGKIQNYEYNLKKWYYKITIRLASIFYLIYKI